MPCIPINIDGVTGIACTRERRRRCRWCNRWAEFLCDGPGKKPGKDCDAPMCAEHALSAYPGHDLCPNHRGP